jgi:hypothetical protein
LQRLQIDPAHDCGCRVDFAWRFRFRLIGETRARLRRDIWWQVIGRIDAGRRKYTEKHGEGQQAS